MKATPLLLRTTDADFEARFQQRLHWSAATDAAIEQRVAEAVAREREEFLRLVDSYAKNNFDLKDAIRAGAEK